MAMIPIAVRPPNILASLLVSSVCQSGFWIDRIAHRVDLRQATVFSPEDEIRDRSAQQGEHASHEIIGAVNEQRNESDA